MSDHSGVLVTLPSVELRAREAEVEPHLSAVAQTCAYYTASTQDYQAWSGHFNMHFGYYRLGLKPWHRESLLESMNELVLEACHVPGPAPRLADLGCGVGATARAVLRLRPDACVDAVTIVPDQITLAGHLTQDEPGAASIHYRLADYTRTGLPAGSYDAVYALESACHGEGSAKQGLIREMARLLRPGGRVVLVDGFRRDARPLRGWIGWVAAAFCRNWALPELPERSAVVQAMAAAGFVNIRVRDLSWRVAPSFAHVPWLATRFTITELIRHRGRLPAWRWRHIKASYLSLVVGLIGWRFGYFMVTAERPAAVTAGADGITPR